MDLYHQLADIFEIGTIDIDKANRRTLKKYAVRTKFQKRREAFYSVCKDGQKSKVAICKTEDRPTWVHNLDTLKTKQLRKQLSGFLEELGILKDPKSINVKKLAKEKNWHEVLYMQDKKGGVNPVPASPGVQHGFQRAAPPGSAPPPQGGRPQAVAPGSGGVPLNINFGGQPPAQPVMAGVVEPNMAAVPPQQSQLDLRIANLEQLQQAKKSGDMNAQFQKLTSMLETKSLLRPPPQLPDPERVPDKPYGFGGDGDGGGHAKDFDIVKVGQDCFFINDDEKCVCKPHTVKVKDMSKQTKRKLKELAEHKQLTCSKIDLLRCLSVEFDTQSKVWGKFNHNCQGDFLATITAETVKELGSKNAMFSGPDLHSMKSVAQCYNLSQNLAKGHKDSLARFKDRSAIDQDYTLGHLCYDELLSNVRKFGDDWSKRAYQNRIPDPNPKKLMYCQQEDGAVEIVDVAPQPSTLITTQCPGPSCPSGGGGGYGGPGASGPPGPAGRDAPTRITPPHPPPPRGPGPGPKIEGGKGKPYLTFPPHEISFPDPYFPDSPKYGKPYQTQTSRCSQMRVALATMQHEKKKTWNKHGLDAATLADVDELVNELVVEIRKNQHELSRFVEVFWGDLKGGKISETKYEYLQRITIGFCEHQPWVSGLKIDSNTVCQQLQEYFQWHQLYCLEETNWVALATLIKDGKIRENLTTKYPDGSGWRRFVKWYDRFKEEFGLKDRDYRKWLKWVLKFCGDKAAPPVDKPEKPKPDPWQEGMDHECDEMMKLMDDLYDRRLNPQELPRLKELIHTYTSQRGQWSPQMRDYTWRHLRQHYDNEITLPESQHEGMKAMLMWACEGGTVVGPQDECDFLTWTLMRHFNYGLSEFEWNEFWRVFEPYLQTVQGEDQYILRSALDMMRTHGTGYPETYQFMQIIGWVYQVCRADLEEWKKKKKKKKLETWIDDPWFPDYDPEPPKPGEDLFCAKFQQDLQMARPGPNNIIPLQNWRSLQERIRVFMEATEQIGAEKHAKFELIYRHMLGERQFQEINLNDWNDFVNTLTRICEGADNDPTASNRPDEPCDRIRHMLYEANSNLGLTHFGETGWTELFQLLQPVYAKMLRQDATFVRDLMFRRLGVVRGNRPTADQFARLVEIIDEACRRDGPPELGDEKQPDEWDEKDEDMDERIVECAEMLTAFDTWAAGGNIDQNNLYRSILSVVDADLVGEHRYKHMNAVLHQLEQGGAAPDDVAKCRDTIEFGCRRIGGQTMRPPKNDICEWVDFMLGEANALSLNQQEWAELQNAVMAISQNMHAQTRQEVNRAIGSLMQGVAIPFNHFIQLREQLWTTCTEGRHEQLLNELGVKPGKKPPKKPDKPWKKKKYDRYDYCIEVILLFETLWERPLSAAEWARFHLLVQPMGNWLQPDTLAVIQALNVQNRGLHGVDQNRYLWARHDIWATCMGYPRPDPADAPQPPGGFPPDEPDTPPPPEIPDQHPCEWLFAILRRIEENGYMLIPELRTLVLAGLHQMNQHFPNSGWAQLANMLQQGDQQPGWWQALLVKFQEQCKPKKDPELHGDEKSPPPPPIAPAPVPGPGANIGGGRGQPIGGGRPGPRPPGGFGPAPFGGRGQPIGGPGGRPGPAPGGGRGQPPARPPVRPPFGAVHPAFHFAGGPAAGRGFGYVGPAIPVQVNPPVPQPVAPQPAAQPRVIDPIRTPSIAVSREMRLVLAASQLVNLVSRTGIGNGQAMALKNALTAADHFLQNQQNVNQLYPILQQQQMPTIALLNAAQRDLTLAWEALIRAQVQMPATGGRSPSPSPGPPGPSPGGRPPLHPAFMTSTYQPPPVAGLGDQKDPEVGDQKDPEAADAAAPVNPAAFGQPHGAAAGPQATAAPHADPQADVGAQHASAVAAHEAELAGLAGSAGSAGLKPLQPTVSGSTAYHSGVSAAAHRQPPVQPNVMIYPLTAPSPSMQSVDEFIAAPTADLSSQPYMVEILMFYKELNIAGFDDSQIAQRLSSLGSGRVVDSVALRDKVMLSQGLPGLGVSRVPLEVTAPIRQPRPRADTDVLLRQATARHAGFQTQQAAIRTNLDQLPVHKRQALRSIASAQQDAREAQYAISQGQGTLATGRQLQDAESNIRRHEQQSQAFTNFASILQEQHEANQKKMEDEKSNIDMLTRLRKRTQRSGTEPERERHRRRRTGAEEDEFRTEFEAEAAADRAQESRAFLSGRRTWRERQKPRGSRPSLYDDPQEELWGVNPEYRAPELEATQEAFRTPAQRPFGIQPQYTAPLSKEEVDEQEAADAAKLRGLGAGHEIEAGLVPGFRSPMEAPITQMERRAQQMRSLDAPEEGQFLDAAGQGVRSGTAMRQAHDIEWKSKTAAQWQKAHRTVERKFKTKSKALSVARANLARWRDPIKKVTPEDNLELLEAISQTARHKEISAKNARFLQYFIRPAVTSRFAEGTWKKTAARGRKITPAVAGKLMSLAKTLREHHNRTIQFSFEDALPILQALGEERALKPLLAERARSFQRIGQLSDETGELALEAERFGYAIQMTKSHPEQITAKKRRAKRGIKSKVKQMGRFSEDSGPDPAPKRARGPAGIIREEEARVEKTGRTGSPMPKRQNIASGPGPFGAGQFSRRSRQMQQRTFYRGRSGRSSSDPD